MANITLDEAVRICDTTIAKAEELGIKVAASVVDSGTNLVASHRMDGALVLATEGSRGKAVASTIFGQPSGEVEPRADRPVFRALQIQMGGRLIMSQGAVPDIPERRGDRRVRGGRRNAGGGRGVRPSRRGRNLRGGMIKLRSDARFQRALRSLPLNVGGAHVTRANRGRDHQGRADVPQSGVPHQSSG